MYSYIAYVRITTRHCSICKNGTEIFSKSCIKAKINLCNKYYILHNSHNASRGYGPWLIDRQQRWINPGCPLPRKERILGRQCKIRVKRCVCTTQLFCLDTLHNRCPAPWGQRNNDRSVYCVNELGAFIFFEGNAQGVRSREAILTPVLSVSSSVDSGSGAERGAVPDLLR